MCFAILEKLPDWIPPWLLVVLPIVYGYYKYFTWNFGVFKKIGVNGPRPFPVIGTMWPMMRRLGLNLDIRPYFANKLKGLMKHDLEMKEKYGSVVGTFQGRHAIMIIYDIDIIKQILIKDFSNFTNHFTPPLSEYPLDKMITMLKDDHWKHVRNILTPTFSSGKMRKMNEQIRRCTETLCNNLQSKADSQEVCELRSLCGAYTMDVIASTAFRVEIDSHNDPQNQFVQMGTKAFKFNFASPKMILFFFLPFLMKPLAKIGFSIFPRNVLGFFVNAVNKAMEERGVDSKYQTDFLQIMINAHLEEEEGKDKTGTEEVVSGKDNWSKRGLTHDEIVAQGLLFFLAGFETTANTLALLGYNLARHPECQEKLYQEIMEVTGGQEQLSYDLVKKMPYLDMCLSETLRMYPAGPRTDRVASEDTTINGLFIPKGMIVGIPIYAIQNDPELWPEPEKFNPDRFLPEEKEKRDPRLYMPFSLGPRNCVGMRLALMELKMSMAHIIQKFKLVPCKETEIPLKMEKMAMRGVNGIKLKIEKRQ